MEEQLKYLATTSETWVEALLLDSCQGFPSWPSCKWVATTRTEKWEAAGHHTNHVTLLSSLNPTQDISEWDISKASAMHWPLAEGWLLHSGHNSPPGIILPLLGLLLPFTWGNQLSPAPKRAPSILGTLETVNHRGPGASKGNDATFKHGQNTTVFKWSRNSKNDREAVGPWHLLLLGWRWRREGLWTASWQSPLETPAWRKSFRHSSPLKVPGGRGSCRAFTPLLLKLSL